MSQPKSTKDLYEFQVQATDIKFQGKGFVIVETKITEHPDARKVGNKVTCKGSFAPVVVGGVYNVKGSLGRDKFGVHLAISDWEEAQSLNETGIINYLMREGPNVGDKRAKQLVSLYGKDTLKVIHDEPERVVRDIPGMALPRVHALREYIIGDKLNLKVKKQLYSLGLGPGTVNRIMGALGDDAHKQIKENPYQLTEHDGFGFKTADEIGKRFGIPRNCQNRIMAGCEYVLKHECGQNGHCCLPQDLYIKKVCELLGVGVSEVVTALKTMLKEGALCTDKDSPSRFTTSPEFFHEGFTNQFTV